jgi:hypothetical protein
MYHEISHWIIPIPSSLLQGVVVETALCITAEGHCTELFLGRDDLSTVMLTDQYIFPLSHVKICSAATTKTILVKGKGRC